MLRAACQKLQKSPLIYALLFVFGNIILSACGNNSTEPAAAVPTTTAISQTIQPTSTENKISPTIQSASTTAIPNNPKTVTPGLQTITPTPVLTNQPPDDWQDHWLKGIPCKAPCWEGITPGKTTPDEAVRLLGQNPLVARPKISYSANPKDPLQSITWDWAFLPQKASPTGGEMNFYSNTQTPFVHSIGPNIDKEYKLKDIIRSYGEPSHVLATYSYSPDFSIIYYELVIIYLLQGFTLANEFQIKKDSDVKPIFDAETLFGLIEFYEPTLDGTTNYKGDMQIKPRVLVPWDGFKGFAFYCRGDDGISNCTKVLGN